MSSSSTSTTTTTNTSEEDLIASLDNSVDQFNHMLSHASTTMSSLDGTSRALPSLRVSMGVAGIMELTRRRSIYLDRVVARGEKQGHTFTDHTVCADQVEEDVLSSGTLKYGDEVERTRDLMRRYWKYKSMEITN